MFGALVILNCCVTIGTTIARSKSGRKPHVKVTSASWERVGRAVCEIFPDGATARVVKTELYETSPPPGNNGGAVSGAGPCATALCALKTIATTSHARTFHWQADFFMELLQLRAECRPVH